MLGLRGPLSNILTTWSSKRSSKSRTGSTSSSASEADSSRTSDGQRTPEVRRYYRASTRSSYTVYTVSEGEYDAAKRDLTKSGCLPAAPVAAALSPSRDFSGAGGRRGRTLSSRVRAWQVGEAEAIPLMEMRPMDHSRPKCNGAWAPPTGLEEHLDEEEKEEPVESLRASCIITGGLSTVWEEDEDEWAEDQRRKKRDKR